MSAAALEMFAILALLGAAVLALVLSRRPPATAVTYGLTLLICAVALANAGFRLVASGLTWCAENPEEAEAGGYPLAEVEKMFMKLA